MVCDVTIHVKNDKVFRKNDVTIDDGALDLTVYEPNGNYSVIPKSSMWWYDVEVRDG